MKKIKEYLTSKPKLKKCLKLLMIVGICLSVIMNGIIIGSAIALRVNSNNNDNVVEVQVTTPLAKGMYRGNDYALLGVEELANDNMWVQYKTCLTNLLASDNTNFDTTWHYPNYACMEVTNLWNNFDLVDNDTSFLVAYEKKNDNGLQYEVIYTLFYKFVSNNNWRYYGYAIIKNYFGVVVSTNSFSTYTGSNIYNFDRSTLITNNNYWRDMVIKVPRYYALDLGITNQLYDYLVLGSEVANEYNQAYNNGYNAGYKTGNQVGYEQGVIDGSQSGVETNAFNVIGQAFQAVANVFSIQILPGLPLWLLVFAPLIMAIVIVVVKMIKG